MCLCCNTAVGALDLGILRSPTIDLLGLFRIQPCYLQSRRTQSRRTEKFRQLSPSQYGENHRDRESGLRVRPCPKCWISIAISRPDISTPSTSPMPVPKSSVKPSVFNVFVRFRFSVFWLSPTPTVIENLSHILIARLAFIS